MPRRDLVDNEVLRRCPAGHPLVLRCHPVRRGRTRPEPFPTLFWLECEAVCAQIARIEHAGGVAVLERRIAEDPGLRARVHADHEAYVEERWSLLSDAEREVLEAAGMAAALRSRGIGGIVNRDSVKCLHLHYAHHLARGTALGPEIESLGPVRPCGA